MTLESGEVFAGYTIVRRLGAGGMGEVYLARHPRLPREDAIKVLPPQLAADDDFRRRFLREADLAAGLVHPNIVGVHDRGEDGGRLWLSMPFITGTDAAELLHAHPAGLPLDRVVTMITDTAAALDFAHRHGVLHRDVKPANIMLSGNHAVLTDFGIARAEGEDSDLTRTGTTIGSVAYASPEQLRGEAVDARADVYSLAATAYTLLTGARAFERSNPAAVVAAVLDGAAAPLAVRRPDLPAGVAAVVATGMARDRGARPRTAGAFASALAAAADGAGTGAAATPSALRAPSGFGTAAEPAWAATHTGPAAPSPPRPAPSPRGRRWVVPTVIVALVALVGTLATVLVLRGGKSDPASAPATPAARVTEAWEGFATRHPPSSAPAATAPSAPAATVSSAATPPTVAPARSAADLGLPQPMTVPACDGSAGVFIVASVGTGRATAASEIGAGLAAYPGSQYLTGAQGCTSLRATANGRTYYQVYMPYPTAAAACAARNRFPSSSYVRILTNDASVPVGHDPC